MKNMLFVLLFAGLLLPAVHGTDYTVVSIGGNLSYAGGTAYVVLDDLAAGSHAAMVSVLDSDGYVLEQYVIGEKKHVIVQIGRDQFVRVSVNQTAPGFAESAKWAQLAIEDESGSPTPTPTYGYVVQLGGVIYEGYGVRASSGTDAPVPAYAMLDDIEKGTMNAIVSVYNSDDELLYRDNIKQGKYVKHTVGNATYLIKVYLTAAGYTHNSAWARMTMEQTSLRPDSYEGTAVSVGSYMLSGDGDIAVYAEDVEEGTRQAMISIYSAAVLGDEVNNGALYYEKIKEGRSVVLSVNDVTYKIKVYKTASGYNLSGKWIRFSITRLTPLEAIDAQADSKIVPGKLLRAGSGPEIDAVYPFYFEFADLETGTRNAMLYIYDLNDTLLYRDEIKERGYVVRTINGSNYKIGITQTAQGYSGNMAWFRYTVSRTNRRATPYDGEVLVPRGLINDSSQTIAVGMYDLEDGSRNAMLAIMPYEGPGSIDQSGVDAPRAYYYENMRENAQAVREVDGQNFRVKIYQTSLGYLGLATWAKVGIASTQTGQTPYVGGTVFVGNEIISDDSMVYAVLDDIETDSHEAILSVYGYPGDNAAAEPQQGGDLLFQTKARAGQNITFDHEGYTYNLGVLATAQGYNDDAAWAKMEITGGGQLPENA